MVDDKTYDISAVFACDSFLERMGITLSFQRQLGKLQPSHVTTRLRFGQSSVLLIVATKNLRCGLISPLASPRRRSTDDFEKTLKANTKQFKRVNVCFIQATQERPD